MRYRWAGVGAYRNVWWQPEIQTRRALAIAVCHRAQRFKRVRDAQIQRIIVARLS